MPFIKVTKKQKNDMLRSGGYRERDIVSKAKFAVKGNKGRTVTFYKKHNNHGNPYLLKYISKTGERIVYSRGIPTAIYMKVKDKDIATTMQDYVTKYLLFDDVINYERDIARYKTKQMTFIDIFCNPPKVA